MSKDKEKKPETKPLLNTQAELVDIKIKNLNQVNEIFNQRKTDLGNTINMIALELGVPEGELGEWGLSQDGKTLIKAGKQKRFPGFRTVKKREKEKKKKPGKNQQPGEEG